MLRCKHTFVLFFLFVTLCLSTTVYALNESNRGNASQSCMISAMESGLFEELSLGELRQRCATSSGRISIESTIAETDKKDQPVSLLEQRLDTEEAGEHNPFTLTAHRRNYLLPVTYNNNTNGRPFDVDSDEVENIEAKFQISFKFPIWNDIIGDADLWGAYTNISFWQAYNDTYSSPFRDSNHEPEMFLAVQGKREILGFQNTYNTFGIVHQSNGQGGSRSRSWNRVYLHSVFERGNLAITFKPWYRQPEDKKSSETDPSGDDNPDIDRFMGYGEITAGYKLDDHVFSVLLRNNLRESGNKGAVQLDWTFPLTQHLKGYVQYFNGYGESLIDYNASVNRIGVGIVLTDSL